MPSPFKVTIRPILPSSISVSGIRMLLLSTASLISGVPKLTPLPLGDPRYQSDHFAWWKLNLGSRKNAIRVEFDLFSPQSATLAKVAKARLLPYAGQARLSGAFLDDRTSCIAGSFSAEGHMDQAQNDVQRETLQAQAVMRNAEFHVRDVALVILTGLAVMYTLYFAAGIILPFVLALVLSLLLSPAARFLTERLRLPRMLAAVLLICALFSAIGGIGYAISVPASGWIEKAPQSLPELQKKLSFLRRPINMFEGGMQQMQHLMQQAGRGAEEGEDAVGQEARPQKPQQAVPPQAATANPVAGAGVGLSLLAGTRSFLGQTLTLLITLFFLLADGDALLRRFVEILPGLTEKKHTVIIAKDIERNISGYLATITLMNLLVGTANGLSIWAFGLPDPLLWGTAAFLLNYVPILGPLTGVVIFFFVALFSFSSVLWALAPSGVYLLIHIMEGETITPMLLARRFTLNPLLVIVALMFWDWLWGVAGALLAVPLLAVFKILCDNIEVLTPIGHLLGAEPSKRRAG